MPKLLFLERKGRGYPFCYGADFVYTSGVVSGILLVLILARSVVFLDF